MVEEDPHRSVDMGSNSYQTTSSLRNSTGDGTIADKGEQDVDLEKKGCLQAMKPAPCPWTLGAYLRLLFVVAIIGGLITAVIFKKQVGDFLGPDGSLAKFVQETGVWGPIVYAGVYAVCTVIMVPGLVLTVAAGVIFELWVALVTISAGSVIGACLAFLLGRSILREQVKAKIEQYPVFEAVDAAVGGGEWRGMGMVFLLRLSPVIPFNLLNYMLGLTKVAFWKYAVASWFGMMPGTFMYVYISWAAKNAGAKAASGKEQDKGQLLKDILTYGVGGVVTIVVVLLVTFIARREMKKAVTRAEAAASTDDVEDADIPSTNSLNNESGSFSPTSPLLKN